MQHIYDLIEAKLEKPSIVTVGVFDGVHLGHQFLIRHLVEQAQTSNRASVVLTFFPHPDVVIRGVHGRYYLTSPETRAELLAQLGVDLVVTHPFNEAIRQIRAADFVDQLRQCLNLSILWATADFAMGYRREGNIGFLREQGRQKGFTVETIEMLSLENTHVTSSGIRDTLEAGEIETANRLLGRPYQVSGVVVHGEQRGRKIGFPTANVAAWEEQVLPQSGVYAGWAHLGSETFMAVTNIGNRPTFAGQGITVEAHLLDFDRDIYGQELTLDFVQRLRGEVKFSGIDALIAQIHQDVQNGRAILTQ